MTSFKQIISTSILSTSLAFSAMASEGINTNNEISPSKENFSLISNNNLQNFSELSSEEMKSTEGSYAVFLVITGIPEFYATAIPVATAVVGFAQKAAIAYGTRPTFGEMYTTARNWFR